MNKTLVQPACNIKGVCGVRLRGGHLAVLKAHDMVVLAMMINNTQIDTIALLRVFRVLQS